MTVEQVIEHARSGELSNLTAEGFTDETMLLYINLGIIELYKRFALSTADALLTMRTVKTIYSLDGNDVDVDLPKAFMYIIGVYDENGEELNINVESDPYSIMTPSFNEVQIPNPADGDMISIIYGAEPIYLTSVSQNIPIPVTMLEALLHYVGYRAHGAVNGEIQAENSTHYQRFEASCSRLKTLGIMTPDDVFSHSAQTKGFV